MNLCEIETVINAGKSGPDAATGRMVDAMNRYAKFGSGYRVIRATPWALGRIAEENWAAKSTLREILRKHEGWDEEMQEVRKEITVNVETDYFRLRHEIRNFVSENAAAGKVDTAIDAVWVISEPEAVCPMERESYENLTGHKFNPKRKLSKSLREILMACGAWTDVPGSECQRKYAEWSNALNGMTEKREIHLSIDPAAQLTQSNPHEDVRGRTLISCHSLDNQNYGYSAGNSGYATDTVTMILYTCAEGDRYTRKTSRQLYMYNDGTLLQSRLYDTSGANDRGEKISAVYRTTVQKIIADCLGVPNNWTEPENAAYADCITTERGFGGYPDYEYSGTGCTVSHLTAWDDYRPIVIGGPGICLCCGGDICSDDGAICIDCDDTYVYCDLCGDRIRADNARETTDGEYICEYCADRHDYAPCDCCGQYTNMYYCIIGTGETLCESCFTDGDYAACDYCGDWYDADDLEAVQVYGCRRHADGQTLYVCNCCRGDLDTGGHLTAPEAEED